MAGIRLSLTTEKAKLPREATLVCIKFEIYQAVWNFMTLRTKIALVTH